MKPHRDYLLGLVSAPIFLLVAMLCFSALTGCVNTPGTGTVTPAKEIWAQATTDALSVGLVPVFSKNPAYIESASAFANALLVFNGSVSTSDLTALVDQCKFAPEDRKVIVGTIHAAWNVYTTRYAQATTASLRPDLRLFLNAVAVGVLNAAGAVPK